MKGEILRILNTNATLWEKMNNKKIKKPVNQRITGF